MKSKAVTILSIVLIIVSAILTVISYIYLPSTVITQLTIGSSSPSTNPKLVAIALPALLSLGGGCISLFSKNEGKNKPIFISIIGVIIFIIMLAVNL